MTAAVHKVEVKEVSVTVTRSDLQKFHHVLDILKMAPDPDRELVQDFVDNVEALFKAREAQLTSNWVD